MELVDRINAAAKELGMDGSIVDLAERLIDDERPQLKDAYLFGQTVYNQDSEFQAAKLMQQEKLANTFWVINSIEAEGFPGYAKWLEGLGNLVGHENVKPLSIQENMRQRFWKEAYQDAKTGLLIPAHCNVNTLSESQSLVTLAQNEGRHFWYAVSTQFHFLRAYMTLASEAISQEERGGPLLSIFNYLGTEQPWDERVMHSQGTLVATRAELLAAHEMQRIRDYTKILPARDIMDYMDRRTLPPQPPQPLNSGSLAHQS